MNKYILPLLIAIGATFSSCKDTEEPLFFVDLEREFDIPANLNTIETHFFELKNIPVFLNENLTTFNRTAEDITSINPGDCFISSAFNNVDWTFIQRIEVFAVSRLDNSQRARMYQSNEPDFNNRDQLGLFPTFNDVQEIFKEGLIDLEVRIKTRAFVPGNIRARLDFNYAVFTEI